MRVRLSPEEFENMHADTTDRNLKLSKMTESQVCGDDNLINVADE